MVVIKRDGREADFDRGKIYNAIYKAFVEVDKLTPIENKDEITRQITSRLQSRYSI